MVGGATIRTRGGRGRLTRFRRCLIEIAMATRIGIVDDHRLFREGLKAAVHITGYVTPPDAEAPQVVSAAALADVEVSAAAAEVAAEEVLGERPR